LVDPSTRTYPLPEIEDTANVLSYLLRSLLDRLQFRYV
jgi:hypothetical protein